MSHTKTARPVRVHWPLNDGRQACGYDAPRVALDAQQLERVPFCGACLLVLMLVRCHSEKLWTACEPPDIRPSEALELLGGTPWAELVGSLTGPDTWWFENNGETK